MRDSLSRRAAASTPDAPPIACLPAVLRIVVAPLLGHALLAGRLVEAGLLLALAAACDAAAPRWARVCGSDEAERQLEPLADALLLGTATLAAGASGLLAWPVVMLAAARDAEAALLPAARPDAAPLRIVQLVQAGVIALLFWSGGASGAVALLLAGVVAIPSVALLARRISAARYGRAFNARTYRT